MFSSFLDSLSIELSVRFLDDGILGGTTEFLYADLALVKMLGEAWGLSYNLTKCEIITSTPVMTESLFTTQPGGSTINPENSILQGALLFSRTMDKFLIRR